MKRDKKMLILAGGSVAKLDAFAQSAKNLNIEAATASFSEVNYKSFEGEHRLFIGNKDIAGFNLIYFRVVGKRLEDATLVANYAKKKHIRVVDSLYTDSLLMPGSLSKAQETAKLIEAGIPMPKTVYGDLEYLTRTAPEKLGYPFVVKSTSGKKAREVWIVEDVVALHKSPLLKELQRKEQLGMRFFAQEFVKASMRYRVFVLGNEVLAVASAPTKWRKRFNKEELEKGLVSMPTTEMQNLGLAAARAVGLDISGVDILKVDDTGELLVIEATAAPSWKLIEKLTGKNMAEEILKWLVKLK